MARLKTKEALLQSPLDIQSYKIARGWRSQDVLQPTKWHDLFRRNFADDAIGQDMNEFDKRMNLRRQWSSTVSNIPA